jgi:hypothetical protein
MRINTQQFTSIQSPDPNLRYTIARMPDGTRPDILNTAAQFGEVFFDLKIPAWIVLFDFQQGYSRRFGGPEIGATGAYFASLGMGFRFYKGAWADRPRIRWQNIRFSKPSQ